MKTTLPAIYRPDTLARDILALAASVIPKSLPGVSAPDDDAPDQIPEKTDPNSHDFSRRWAPPPAPSHWGINE